MTVEEKKICCVCGISDQEERTDGTFVSVFIIDDVPVCEDCDDRVNCFMCGTETKLAEIEVCAKCGHKICPDCIGELPVHTAQDFCGDCTEIATKAFNDILGFEIL